MRHVTTHSPHPPTLPPVGRSAKTHDAASLIQRIHNFFRERPLLTVFEVLFELRNTTRAEDDTVIRGENGVVLAPPQGDLRQAQLVLLLRARMNE